MPECTADFGSIPTGVSDCPTAGSDYITHNGARPNHFPVGWFFENGPTVRRDYIQPVKLVPQGTDLGTPSLGCMEKHETDCRLEYMLRKPWSWVRFPPALYFYPRCRSSVDRARTALAKPRRSLLIQHSTAGVEYMDPAGSTPVRSTCDNWAGTLPQSLSSVLGVKRCVAWFIERI